MKHARELFWHYWLPLLVMLTLINIESTDALSGGHTGQILRSLLLWIGWPLPSYQIDLLNLIFRKSGHMIGYAMLCFCWLLLLRGTYWLQHEYMRSLQGKLHVRRMWWRTEWAVLAVFCTFVVASADELHQMSIPSRSGSWSDVALDTSAGLIAIALVWAKAAWLCRGEPTSKAAA